MNVLSKIIFCGIIACIASCTTLSSYVDKYIEIPDVRIERMSSATGYITSAAFVVYREQLFLKGSVRGHFVSKGYLSGHVDIAIYSPGTLSASCVNTRYKTGFRRVRKPFYYPFGSYPDPGTEIRVWHHNSPTHDECVGI